MKLTRIVLGVGVALSGIGGPIQVYAQETS